MKNTLNSKSSTIESYLVRQAARYRSNPGNRYHRSYQKAVNRVFVLSVYLLSMCMITVHYGWEGALATVVGLPLGMIFVAALIAFVTEIILPITGEVIDWIFGH